MAVASARVKMIEEVAPFGDVPLAPSAATGRSEAELARAIADGLRESARPSERDALALTARLAGVGALMRRASRSAAEVGAPKHAA
ncbi:MAG TPA: hypothetical protein VGX95_17675 [Xanthobacteraceae bacterium]|jgi:hypothetical protein|nr:hypothetical protein [Xanthobacteraceae bacterium]